MNGLHMFTIENPMKIDGLVLVKGSIHGATPK